MENLPKSSILQPRISASFIHRKQQIHRYIRIGLTVLSKRGVKTKDIGNLAVISAEKAASIIRNARKVVNKHLDKALKEAQGDI